MCSVERGDRLRLHRAGDRDGPDELGVQRPRASGAMGMRRTAMERRRRGKLTMRGRPRSDAGRGGRGSARVIRRIRMIRSRRCHRRDGTMLRQLHAAPLSDGEHSHQRHQSSERNGPRPPTRRILDQRVFRAVFKRRSDARRASSTPTSCAASPGMRRAR